MIRYSVLYPAAEGARFDHDYYRDSHVPLAARTYGVERYEIDRGVRGPFVGGVHFFFDSLDALDRALAVDGTAAVRADIPNFTDVDPQRQVSEVV